MTTAVSPLRSMLARWTVTRLSPSVDLTDHASITWPVAIVVINTAMLDWLMVRRRPFAVRSNEVIRFAPDAGNRPKRPLPDSASQAGVLAGRSPVCRCRPSGQRTNRQQVSGNASRSVRRHKRHSRPRPCRYGHEPVAAASRCRWLTRFVGQIIKVH